MGHSAHSSLTAVVHRWRVLRAQSCPLSTVPHFLSWHFWCFSSSSGTASCALKCGWWNQDYKWRFVSADAGWLAADVIPHAGMICNYMLECIIKWTNPKETEEFARLCLSWKPPKKYLICKSDELFSKKTRRCRFIPYTRTHISSQRLMYRSKFGRSTFSSLFFFEGWQKIKCRILRLMKRVSLHKGEQFLWPSWEGPTWHFWACLHLHYRRQASAHQVLHSHLKVCLVVCNWLCLCFSVKCE